VLESNENFVADRRVVIASLAKKFRTKPFASAMMRTAVVLALKQFTPWSRKTAPRDWIGVGARASRPTPTILVRKVCLQIKSKWSNMNNARNLEPEMRLKAAQLNVKMGDWVHSLAP
jgi:predicted RNA polymerase sigma factor